MTLDERDVTSGLLFFKNIVTKEETAERKQKIELIDRPGTVMCPLCIEDKPDVKLIKLSSDYLYGTFALCKDCREELIKALGSC